MNGLRGGHSSDFQYYYSYVIKDEDLRGPLGSTTGRPGGSPHAIAITYYKNSARTEELENMGCTEMVTGFHRKLVFNLLSKIPADKKRLEFSARYCYLVFEQRRILFCIDAIVGKDRAVPVRIPAQYLYNAAPENESSTIDDYLANLGRVSDRLRLNTNDTGLFSSRANWPFLAGYIDGQFSVEMMPGRVQFSGTGKLVHHPLGEFVGLVPIPRFGDPAMIPAHGVIAGTLAKKAPNGFLDQRQQTESIRTALEELTHVLWRDGGLTTWVMGQPGTGKEVFAQALHYGSARVLDLRLGDKPTSDQLQLFQDAAAMGLTNGFAIQSVAGVTLEEFQNRLFTVPEGGRDRCAIDIIDQLDGTIFLDEFDKPDNPFALYSSMLRVLEAKQYVKRSYSKEGGRAVRMEEKPNSFSNVNWIFAGAFAQVDPRQHVPFDLWSRLKGFIHLRNPLEDGAESPYGATLFLH